MAPHALLLARDELDADLKVLVIVVVEFDIIRTSACAVEETEVDKPGILIGAAETTDGEHAFDKLPANDCIEVQAWAQVEYVNRKSTTLESLLDPVDEVPVQVFIRDDLHIWNILGRALRKRQTVVRIGRARTPVVSAATSVWRRTITVSIVAVPVTSRRGRWGSVWPVSIPFTIASVTSVSAVSAISPATIARTAGRVAIVSSSTIIRRARASASVDRTHVWPGVLLWISVALGFADFEVCV